MKSFGCLLLLLSFAVIAAAGETYQHLQNFAVPKQFYSSHDFHPIGYIESLPVADPDAVLSRDQQQRLARLFYAVHDACRIKYNQGYYFKTSTPSVRLLLKQFPDLRTRCSENGHLLYTEVIFEYVREQFPSFITK